MRPNSVKDILARRLTGVMQAAGSWSVDACCAVPGNDCRRSSGDGYCYITYPCCIDRASSSDWLFGLGPDPPQRYEPTGTNTVYQTVLKTGWPSWGSGADLSIGFDSRGLPGGLAGDCVKPHHLTSFGCES